MVDLLEPALIATEALSKDSINIVEGEFIIESLVNQTAKLNSWIGERFSEILITKLNQRRNSELTSLALYLLNPDALSKTSTSSYPLKLESKVATQRFGIQLIETLFGTDHDEPNTREEVETPGEGEMSFRDTMNKTIADRWLKATQKEKEGGKPHIIQDFRSYDHNHQRSPLLEKLVLALCSAPPTSTQSERNFSLSGNFVTKLRTKLTPSYVDMLCFLKSYFLNENR